MKHEQLFSHRHGYCDCYHRHWRDINKEPSWVNKIVMIIDVFLNPNAVDWPMAHGDDKTVIFIRWIHKDWSKGTN